ncbi:hypothetical protein L593_12410 [Salinarchaeum sp. Harcht-Bsk1]|uniref:hypothetical protein n=1 Tax=Salinarchaeum sp. Harcht-Bsk1 TaxID=1333523 RepID=UPI000342475E|nr:hypothetical protein [Salinarchaeum sp. Harcht-Bsk1]AGN02421.1 hypothetical protein L593_12410 [Salinarchaeum sp. Harcht-Bsk1]
MRRVQYGDGDERLVFVLGWGNRPEHEGVQWLCEHLIDAGYSLDVFEIPRTISDFERQYLDPVEAHLADLETYRLLSHSTGGLITRYIPADESLLSRTYLSPWWGFHEDLQNPIVRWLSLLPVPWPILPASSDREDLGEYTTDERMADLPSFAAPTFLREARRAQRAMPPYDDRDAVFYTPDDPIVDAPTIERTVPEANRIAYDGGHELFNSESREEHLDAVLAAIDGGIAAVDDGHR